MRRLAIIALLPWGIACVGSVAPEEESTPLAQDDPSSDPSPGSTHGSDPDPCAPLVYQSPTGWIVVPVPCNLTDPTTRPGPDELLPDPVQVEVFGGPLGDV